MTESSDKPAKPAKPDGPEREPTIPPADNTTIKNPQDETAPESEQPSLAAEAPSPSDQKPEPAAASDRPAVESSDASPGQTTAPRRGQGLHTILLIVVLLLLAGVAFALFRGWQLYQQMGVDLQALQQEREQSGNQLKRLQNALNDSSQALAQIREQLEGSQQQLLETRKQMAETRQQAESHIADQSNVLSRMGERLDGQQKRINTLSTTSREDWLLAEAEYLLRLANQRILLERSPQNAIALLDAADSILKEVSAGLGDPELFAIREAIGRELTALRLADNTDKEGVYLQLGALAEAVDTLPRVPGSDLKQAPESALIDSPINPSQDVVMDKPWLQVIWEGVKDAAGVLDQYIRIDEIDAPIKPLLNSADAQIIAMNVRLELQQAQIALLKGQPEVYSYSLDKVNQLVGQYYLPGDPVAKYQAQVTELKAVQTAPDLPDISGSLKLLNAFVKKLHRIGGVGQ